jgi:hypothetical protein
VKNKIPKPKVATFAVLSMNESHSLKVDIFLGDIIQALRTLVNVPTDNADFGRQCQGCPAGFWITDN